MNQLGWWSFAVSIGALAVAVWAVLTSRTTSAAATQVQARLLRLEGARERDRLATARRANIVAFVITADRNTRIYFRNEGEGTARAIQVLMDGRPLSEHDFAVNGDPPPETLSARGEAHCLLAPFMGGPVRARARVTWEDETGPGEWESDLNLA